MVIITRKEVLKLNVNISFKLKDAGNFKTQNNIWETGNTNDKKNIKKQKKDAIKACLPLSVVFSTVLYTVSLFSIKVLGLLYHLVCSLVFFLYWLQIFIFTIITYMDFFQHVRHHFRIDCWMIYGIGLYRMKRIKTFVHIFLICIVTVRFAVVT